MSGRYATDHTEISFLFFIQLAVLFSFFSAQKNGIMNSVLVGVFIGMAILCKWLVALIVIPLFIIIQLQSVNFSYSRLFYYLCVILIFIIIIVAPWQIYIMKTFPKEAYWEYSYNSQHFTRCLEGHCEDAFFYFKVLSVNFGIFIYIPIFYSIYACFRKKEYYSYLFLLIWISVPFFFFSMAKTKMDGYLIIIYPALFLISSAFYFYLNQKTLTRKIISIFFISFFIIYSFHHYIEKNKLLCNFNRSPEWVTNLKKVDISKQKTILFNYPNPIEAMFYKDLTAYSYIPAEDTLLALKERGYQIIIYKNGSFSPL